MDKNKINLTGYTKGSKTKDNAYNVIPSNKITMKKVEGTVMALKLDENGLPIGMEFMKPGKEYDFEDAESVMEIPKHQDGTGPKRPYNFEERWNNDDMVVGFRNMFGMQQNNQPKSITNPTPQGELPNSYMDFMPGSDYMQQQGQTPTTQRNLIWEGENSGSRLSMDANGNPVSVPYGNAPLTSQEYEDQQRAEGMMGAGQMVPQSNSMDVNAPSDTVPGEVPVVTLDDVEQGGQNTGMYGRFDMKFQNQIADMETDLGDNKMKIEPTSPLHEEQELKIGHKSVGVGDKEIPTNPEDDLELRERPNIQFFNPYGGTDIPGAAVGLGAAIENKSALGIIGNSAKLVTGLGRNVVGGIGTQRANNTAMEEYNKNLRKGLDGPVKYGQGGEVRNIEVRHIPGVFMEKGGRIKKEELLTGEYLQGVDQDMPEQMAMVDGEVEAGEYYQTNQGDIAEVVGNKHSRGGEKIPMEEEDRVLTDHTKLGAKNAKDIRDNYDIEVRAKDTYSKVLDKFRSKIGLDKLVKEEEQILKKLEEQDKEDLSDTAGINMHFLENKLAEIRQKKEPIEQVRKILYDKLFSMQEADKPKEERGQGLEIFEKGGNKKRLEDWYNNARSHGYEGELNLDAEDLGVEAGKIQEWMVANKPEEVLKYFRSGQPMTSKGIDILKEKVPKLFSSTGMPIDKPSGQWTPEERAQLYSAIQGTDLDTDEFWLEQFNDNRWEYRGPLMGTNTLSQTGIAGLDMQATPVTSDIEYRPQETQTELSADPEEKERKDKRVKGDTQKKGLNVMNLPDQYPMMPGAMEPHLKDQRRFDRINPIKVDVEPYLNRIYEQQNVANAQTEGYSPAVQAALNANTQAETQKALTDLGMKVDAQNLDIQFKTDVQNAQTQRMEENARLQDNLSYEQRQLMAKAKTDEEYKNYFDKIQEVNLRNYATIDAMNHANARYSDIQFDGTGYQVAPNPYSGDIMRQKIDELMAAENERKKKEAEKTRTA